jgi:O-antigen/teichoic acid export membrane protein
MNHNFSKEDIKKVAKGAGVSLIGSSVGKGLFFLSQVIIARILGVDVFGLYALGFAAVKICEIFARLGLHKGGMRFVSIYKDDNPSKLKGVLVLSIGITLLNGILVGSVLYFSSDWIAQIIFRKPALSNYLQLFAYAIPFSATMNVVSFLFQGFHTMKYTVYTREFIQPITNIFLIVAFYYAGFHLEGVIYAFILSHLMALFAGLLYFKRIIPQSFDKKIKPDFEFGKIISYSTPLLFVGFLEYFLSWTDTLMLGSLSTTKDVGIYRAASQIPFVMTFFFVAISTIYAPIAANLFHRGEMQRFANMFRTTTRWISYSVIPIFIFILFSAKDIMMIFGKGYVETGYIVVIVLSFGQLVNCVTGSLGYTLTMTGKQGIALIFTIVSLAVNIGLNLLLIPKYGVLGAAVSSSISAASINLAKVGAIYRIYKFLPFSAELAKYLIPSIFSSLFIFSLNDVIGIQTGLFINGIIIFVIFGSFYSFLMRNYSEDMFVFYKLKEKLLNLVHYHN